MRRQPVFAAGEIMIDDPLDHKTIFAVIAALA